MPCVTLWTWFWYILPAAKYHISWTLKIQFFHILKLLSSVASYVLWLLRISVKNYVVYYLIKESRWEISSCSWHQSWYAKHGYKSKGDPESTTVYFQGIAVAQWLRDCTTNQKVAGSIPDGVMEFFIDINPSDSTMALGLTEPLTEVSTRSIFWG
jgi:hypothetical protein